MSKYCPECNSKLKEVAGIGLCCNNLECPVSDDAALWDGKGNRAESPFKIKPIGCNPENCYNYIGCKKDLDRVEAELAELDGRYNILYSDYTKLEDELAEAKDSSFSRVVELIGEMSWGIDLPSPMKVVFQSFNGEPEQIHAVSPKNYEPVFDAIWEKLKKAPEYQPHIDLKNELAEAKEQVKDLCEALDGAIEDIDRFGNDNHPFGFEDVNEAIAKYRNLLNKIQGE